MTDKEEMRALKALFSQLDDDPVVKFAVEHTSLGKINMAIPSKVLFDDITLIFPDACILQVLQLGKLYDYSVVNIGTELMVPAFIVKTCFDTVAGISTTTTETADNTVCLIIPADIILRYAVKPN